MTAPARRAGVKPAINLRPGPENRGIWKRRDLSAAPAMPMAIATTAATVQTTSQPLAPGWWAANRAANRATTPISTPPLPGTAVKDPARSNVCRMYFRLSMACSCSSTGCVRGVAITLNDSAAAAGFQVLFDIKVQVGAPHSAPAAKAYEISASLEDPVRMLA